MTWLLPRLERVFCTLGLAAAILALVGRVASGMVVVDPQALSEVSALLAAAVPCQAETDSDGAHHEMPAVPGPDQGLAVLASFLSQPSPLLTPVVFPPVPRQGVVTMAAVLPPARGPPVYRPGAALPRGPPFLT